MKKSLLLVFLLLLVSSNLHSQIIGNSTDIIWKVLEIGNIYTIEFSPDSKYILVYDEQEQSTNIYKTDTGELLKSIPLHKHSAWSKDGNFIATNRRDSIFIWNFPSLDTFRIIKTNTEPSGTTVHISFSWDNRLISSAETNFGFHIWDINTGERVNIIKQFPYGVNYAWKSMFTKDNKKLLYCNGVYTYLFDLLTDKIINTFYGGLGEISPDGSLIATQTNPEDDTNYKNVYIYDASTYERKIILEGDFPGYMTFCFSADSKYLITEPDKKVKPLGIPVWEMATGNVAKYYFTSVGIPMFDGPVASQDGKYIACRYALNNIQVGYLALLKANWNETGVGEPKGDEHKILYPNPANGMISIQFVLPVSSNVNLIITDLRGIQIEIQDLGFFNEGMNVLQYDAGRLHTGTYFLKIESGKYNETFRLVKE